MKYLKYLVSAILAGVFIGIAGTAYLLNQGALGMFLFCFGLFFIVEMELHLYTGKIGFLIEKKNFLEVGITIVGNIIGTVGYSLMMLLTKKKDLLVSFATPKVLSKMDLNFEAIASIFILAIFCGAIMYLAFFAKSKSIEKNNPLMGYLGIVFCIMTFIACGFEHSIANLVYITLAKSWCLETIVMFVIMLIGNAVGAWAIWGINKLLKNRE